MDELNVSVTEVRWEDVSLSRTPAEIACNGKLPGYFARACPKQTSLSRTRTRSRLTRGTSLDTLHDHLLKDSWAGTV